MKNKWIRQMRFISEAIGTDVRWEGKQNTVFIKTEK
ncbi:copper amine oxidase N-terminal domain-containing protein [Schinkia azotoformans]|nr:copper amine oxidase N-terminal domain-containing protein [Schinkia azotoformans]MEC1638620.1 copper amine oxidase N-terminal domain-containing protein [Schinkia azotoformans]MEC1721480.1 copper amine oxidase N-terminal domain-containing protein [Schinkia azotoformans]MEC1945945.1 copper amine oxidase N-terminal domain-containing protein [Schinkia azotoformans]MED4415727.1 copper amine oxidase N-terminal domain-containing protein [Schinkia azotoformans]